MANIESDDRRRSANPFAAGLTTGDTVMLTIAAFAIVWTMLILVTGF